MAKVVFKKHTDKHNLGCTGCVFCVNCRCKAPGSLPDCFGGIWVVED